MVRSVIANGKPLSSAAGCWYKSLKARTNSSTETDSLCAKATANCAPATRQVHNVNRNRTPANARLLREGLVGVMP